MTVKELIDRLNEFNCPDYEIELSNGMKLNSNNIRFSDSGAKIVIGLSQGIRGLQSLIEDLRDCYYDIEDVLDNMSDIFGDLEQLA